MVVMTNLTNEVNSSRYRLLLCCPHTPLKILSCCIRRNFVSLVKHCIWQSFNYVNLLANLTDVLFLVLKKSVCPVVLAGWLVKNAAFCPVIKMYVLLCFFAYRTGK